MKLLRVNFWISELVRRPKDLEFIEFVNLGTVSLSLADVVISGGIDFNFSEAGITEVGPGEYLVIAANPDELGVEGAPSFSGNLGAREEITVAFKTTIIHEFKYGGGEWPDDTHNVLEVTNPVARSALSDGSRWTARTDATPGEPSNFQSIIASLIFTEIRMAPGEWEFIELFNLADTGIDLTGFTIDDDFKYAFEPGFFLEGQSYFIIGREDLEAELEASSEGTDWDSVGRGTTTPGSNSRISARGILSLRVNGRIADRFAYARGDDDRPEWPNTDILVLTNRHERRDRLFAPLNWEGRRVPTPGFEGDDPPLVDPYGDWLNDYGLIGEDAGPTANPDNDGLVNFLEYALGTDPRLPGDAGPSLSLLPILNGLHPSYKPLPIEHPDSELTIGIEASSNLVDWIPLLTHQLPEGTLYGLQPISGTEPMHFYRLTADRQTD